LPLAVVVVEVVVSELRHRHRQPAMASGRAWLLPHTTHISSLLYLLSFKS
jgi:hypothetical protein